MVVQRALRKSPRAAISYTTCGLSIDEPSRTRCELFTLNAVIMRNYAGCNNDALFSHELNRGDTLLVLN